MYWVNIFNSAFIIIIIIIIIIAAWHTRTAYLTLKAGFMRNWERSRERR